MHSFLAKKQQHQDSNQDDGPEDSNSDVDVDYMQDPVAKAGIQDIKAVNNQLTKLAQAHSTHLVQQEQLLLLLEVLDAIMQQGESILIGAIAQVRHKYQAFHRTKKF